MQNAEAVGVLNLRWWTGGRSDQCHETAALRRTCTGSRRSGLDWCRQKSDHWNQQRKRDFTLRTMPPPPLPRKHLLFRDKEKSGYRFDSTLTTEKPTQTGPFHRLSSRKMALRTKRTCPDRNLWEKNVRKMCWIKESPMMQHRKLRKQEFVCFTLMITILQANSVQQCYSSLTHPFISLLSVIDWLIWSIRWSESVSCSYLLTVDGVFWPQLFIFVQHLTTETQRTMTNHACVKARPLTIVKRSEWRLHVVESDLPRARNDA